MSFLIRRPFVYITAGIIIIVLGYFLLTFAGILKTSPSTIAFSSVSLNPESVVEGEDTTLTLTIKNYGNKVQEVELKINAESPLVKFYHPDNESLIAEPEKVGKNYTTIYPVKVDMFPGSEWEVELLVRSGLISGFAGYKYWIQLLLYADKAPADSKVLYLEVKSAA